MITDEEKWLFFTKSLPEFKTKKSIKPCVRKENDESHKFNIYFFLKDRRGRDGCKDVIGVPTLHDLEVITSQFQAICPFEVVRIVTTRPGRNGSTYYKVSHENNEIKLTKEIKGVDYD